MTATLGLLLLAVHAGSAGAAARRCAGDCNCDLAVSDSELTAAIAAVFHTAGGCAAADADDDGHTSAADLVAARDAEASGCPGRDGCNLHTELCARRFDEVAHPTTHNAMSNAAAHWVGPNQDYGITRQLCDGVRGMMLDTHYDGNVPSLCHEHCGLGKQKLVDGLGEIRSFLERQPRQIVSIIFEAYISEEDTEQAFADSGLLDYVHVQPPNEPWPTLEEMIESGHRLVVFTDERGVLPWHHYVWDYAWETHYSFETPANFSCAINRGNMANSLFILNHFLTQGFGSPVLARQVNYNPLFVDRADQCQSESGRLPNFVTVDFYDIGDLFDVVDHLNGVAPE